MLWYSAHEHFHMSKVMLQPAEGTWNTTWPAVLTTGGERSSPERYVSECSQSPATDKSIILFLKVQVYYQYICISNIMQFFFEDDIWQLLHSVESYNYSYLYKLQFQVLCHVCIFTNTKYITNNILCSISHFPQMIQNLFKMCTMLIIAVN